MNEHFYCQGNCGGVSSTPGVCQTDHCSNQGKGLTPCNCGKEEHKRQEDSGEDDQK